MRPLNKDEVKEILRVCKYSATADTKFRRPFKTIRPTYRRDKAILLVLLDTGIRSSELCNLKIGDLDLKTGEISIKHGRDGGAKGSKGRTVFIGKITRKTVWRYLVDRSDNDDNSSYLFISARHDKLNKNSLRLLITRLGKRAGLKKCHPHLFRHTFAIRYLRAQGDVFTLQVLLGHSSLEMVRRYSRIAKIDLQRKFYRSSPVDNLGL